MTAPEFYKEIKPENLPMPDRQVMRLIQYTLSDDAEIETLTRLISINPALTAQLLGVVNSAFFGFRQSIHTISEALVAMGMKRLKNLILDKALHYSFIQAKCTQYPGFMRA